MSVEKGNLMTALPPAAQTIDIAGHETGAVELAVHRLLCRGQRIGLDHQAMVAGGDERRLPPRVGVHDLGDPPAPDAYGNRSRAGGRREL